MCIGRSDAIDLIERDVKDLSHASGHVGDKGTLVALATMWYGSHVGRVGLKQDAVECDDWQRLGQGTLLEGEHATDAKVEISHLTNAVNLLWCSCEAVKHPLGHLAAELTEHIEDLIENKSFTQNIKDLVQESGR